MKYRKILLAYNGTQDGKRALLECADLAGFLKQTVAATLRTLSRTVVRAGLCPMISSKL